LIPEDYCLVGCGAMHFGRQACNNVSEEGTIRILEDGSRRSLRSLVTSHQNKWRHISKDRHHMFTSAKTSNHTRIHDVETGNKLNTYYEGRSYWTTFLAEKEMSRP
jgi:hypothetical protein